tara:strand:- start:587 stop:895 length:309 start_codon:yes stop_codon:yes gene_type:complete
METLGLIAVLLLVQTSLNAISDSIIHHNSYKGLGYFFSQEAYTARKNNWFHKYFPMFHDFWHLSKVLQTICTMGIVYIATTSLIFIAIMLLLRGLWFNLIYK